MQSVKSWGQVTGFYIVKHVNATKKITNITVAVLQLLKYSSEQYLPYSHILDNISENKATLKCFDYNQAYNQACTRTVPFLVVPGRSSTILIIFGTERPGTRNDLIWKIRERGRAWNGVVPGRSRVRAQHRNGMFWVRTILCQDKISQCHFSLRTVFFRRPSALSLLDRPL